MHFEECEICTFYHIVYIKFQVLVTHDIPRDIVKYFGE